MSYLDFTHHPVRGHVAEHRRQQKGEIIIIILNIEYFSQEQG